MSVVKSFVDNVAFKKENSTNWEEFMSIKMSQEQILIDHEIEKEINENGMYSVFCSSNSKEEIKKRLDSKRSEKWKRSGVMISGITVLILIAQFYFLVNPSR